jgi:hypothetical protein
MIAPEKPRQPPEAPEERNSSRANIAALVFIALLVALGIWLFNKLDDANSTLNCMASGRRNCERQP